MISSIPVAISPSHRVPQSTVPRNNWWSKMTQPVRAALKAAQLGFAYPKSMPRLQYLMQASFTVFSCVQFVFHSYCSGPEKRLQFLWRALFPRVVSPELEEVLRKASQVPALARALQQLLQTCLATQHHFMSEEEAPLFVEHHRACHAALPEANSDDIPDFIQLILNITEPHLLSNYQVNSDSFPLALLGSDYFIDYDPAFLPSALQGKEDPALRFFKKRSRYREKCRLPTGEIDLDRVRYSKRSRSPIVWEMADWKDVKLNDQGGFISGIRRCGFSLAHGQNKVEIEVPVEFPALCRQFDFKTSYLVLTAIAVAFAADESATLSYFETEGLNKLSSEQRQELVSLTNRLRPLFIRNLSEARFAVVRKIINK